MTGLAEEWTLSVPPGAASLASTVSGRRIVLVGSAPGATLDGARADVVALVNGAALGLSLPVVPDVLFLNTAVAACQRAGRPTRERLAQLSAEALLIIESGTSLDDAATAFEAVSRRTTAQLPLAQRTRFLEGFQGRPLASPWGGAHVPSTGFLSCLLLLAAGARHVQMRGFSFGDGHSYLPDVFRRGHVERDREILDLILRRRLPVELHVAPA